MAEGEDPVVAKDSSGDEVFQAQYIPKQKPPPPSDHPSMKMYISTFPPLGQVTSIDQNTILFTALLEVAEGHETDPWEVSLWYTEGKEWKEVPMELQGESSIFPTYLRPQKQAPSHLIFTSKLPIGLPTTFTVKFRPDPHHSWKWVKDHQGIGDGIALLKSITSHGAISNDLAHYVEGLNPALNSKICRSQSPGTTLWAVETPIEAANGENSTIKDIPFGLPWGDGKFSRWFALVRLWSPWLAPRQGKSRFDVDKEALLCSFLSTEGKHIVLLAISGVDDVMTLLKSDGNGNVVMRVRNDGDSDRIARVLVGLGDDFESANAAVMYHARGVVSAAKSASRPEAGESEALHDEPSTKLWQENWYDGLTYCTWNALGQRLNEEKIIKAVEILAENKINITNFIIDDNWQDIDYRGDGQFQYGWNSFEAEPQNFPKGLKHTVNLIREKHPSIQHVAVWHALLGYWGGIAPDGELAKTYKTVEVMREDLKRRNLPLGGKITVVAKEEVNKFYDAFYRFLSAAGVDGVKTDGQFMIDTFASATSRRDLISAYQDAWAIAHSRYFSVKAISCMSQTPDILFHSQLPQNRLPILSRNSDDFFPKIPASHPWHIFVNAYNALLTQHLNVVPDWDMFQTVHEYSGFHAAARCVSGGPIYITDVPGQHDMNLIEQMTGTTTREKTVIFRPSVMGKTLDPYIGYDDNALLLVGAYHGGAVTGTGIIGVFNVSQRPISELIPLSKFPGVVEAQYYIVRAHSTGLISKPLQVVDPNALIYISLEVRGYDILSSYPLRGFFDEKSDETTWVANLGLVGKMAAAAAVVSNTITKQENGRIVLESSLKALGVLGIYISTLPSFEFKDRLIISILGNVVPVHTVRVSVVDKHVLEVDVEAAWNELDLEPGWSNEANVKVFLDPIK